MIVQMAAGTLLAMMPLLYFKQIHFFESGVCSTAAH